MINSIKNKYYSYPTGEFLPIFEDGQLANARDYHLYKLRKAFTPVISKLLDTI